MNRALRTSLLGVGTFAAVLIALYLWVLLAPTTASPARWLPWPVACSTRGCITTGSWERQRDLNEAFAKASELEVPAPHDALTTLIRQHLVRFATPTTDVTLSDAARYREDILNVSSTEQLQETLPLTLEEYDELIVLPYLAQESLLQQQRAEGPADLYQKLANERLIIVLPFQLRWNIDTATVISR